MGLTCQKAKQLYVDSLSFSVVLPTLCLGCFATSTSPVLTPLLLNCLEATLFGRGAFVLKSVYNTNNLSNEHSMDGSRSKDDSE